jgi:hypothetical protein
MNKEALSYIAVFLIILGFVYLYFQERPLVKVWDKEIVILTADMPEQRRG